MILLFSISNKGRDCLSITRFATYLFSSGLSILTDWIIKHCPCECHVAEYIISDCAISFHKDLGRDYAFNYILDTGGENVITEFWDDSAQQLLSSVICEPNQWYVLNVSKQHRVLEPQPRPRVLVSITPKYGVTYQF